MKTVLILGGYGNAGKLIARCLLEETDDLAIIISGRDAEKAWNEANALNKSLTTDQVSVRAVEASSKESLDNGFAGVDIVVIASSTMCPLTRCSPLANRKIADTSALRQQGLVTVRRASSSFT